MTKQADGIAKLGFRRWYERQLIESHAWLVTGVLCTIVVAASLEGFSVREANAATLAGLAIVFASGVVGWEAFKRYIAVLNRAEHVAEHSVCANCSTYGRLEVLGSGGERDAGRPAEGGWMQVACRKCGHRWLID